MKTMLPSELFSGLLTDLYELTMAAGYVQNGFNACATFELFVRHLPRNRNYLVAAGLEQALDFLENVRFSPDEVSYIRALPIFGHVQSGFFTSRVISIAVDQVTPSSVLFITHTVRLDLLVPAMMSLSRSSPAFLVVNNQIVPLARSTPGHGFPTVFGSSSATTCICVPVDEMS